MIAAYARYEDYHHVVKTKAVELLGSISKERYEKINYRICRDFYLIEYSDYRTASSGARFEIMAYYVAQSTQSERYN